MALTDTAIRATKPGLKPFKLDDREGLFLLLNPGGSKLWRWRYPFESKEKLNGVGRGSACESRPGREFHLASCKTLAARIDPMAERKAEGEAKQREAEARQREDQNSYENIARQRWAWWLLASLRVMRIPSCAV